MRLFTPICDDCGSELTGGVICTKINIRRSVEIPLPRRHTIKVRLSKTEGRFCESCGKGDLDAHLNT